MCGGGGGGFFSEVQGSRCVCVGGMAVDTCRREEEAHPQVSTSSGASHSGGRQQPQVLESRGVVGDNSPRSQ